jgi:transcription initiation factor IIE alpha subunit
MMQQTSLLAYVELKHLGDKQVRIYDTIERLGSACNYDIAHELDWEVNRVTGRVMELREMKLVVVAYKEVHPVTNRKVIYWKTTGTLIREVPKRIIHDGLYRIQ